MRGYCYSFITRLRRVITTPREGRMWVHVIARASVGVCAILCEWDFLCWLGVYMNTNVCAWLKCRRITERYPSKKKRASAPLFVFAVSFWVIISFPHLKNGHVVLPVDLVGRWVKPVALAHVLVENATALHVAQTELTEVEFREPATPQHITH